MSGKLIVLEGTDGSGKSTQFSKLCQRLDIQGREYQRLVFPQYDKPSSALIRMYLGGEFGDKPEDVNPYAASTFYAVDRYASFKTTWGAPYQKGMLTLADRYTTSNAVHQGAKCHANAQTDFLRWLDKLEYEKMALPRPDLVIYLDMPTQHAQTLLQKRVDTGGGAADIHEKDMEYLAQCRRAALLAGKLLGWHMLPCADAQGKLRSIDNLHAEIWDLVSQLL